MKNEHPSEGFNQKENRVIAVHKVGSAYEKVILTKSWDYNIFNGRGLHGNANCTAHKLLISARTWQLKFQGLKVDSLPQLVLENAPHIQLASNDFKV